MNLSRRRFLPTCIASMLGVKGAARNLQSPTLESIFNNTDLLHIDACEGWRADVWFKGRRRGDIIKFVGSKHEGESVIGAMAVCRKDRGGYVINENFAFVYEWSVGLVKWSNLRRALEDIR